MGPTVRPKYLLFGYMDPEGLHTNIQMDYKYYPDPRPDPHSAVLGSIRETP